ncbi:MAG: hypothetical protein RLZZ598_1072, partial [Pseudomonadota bacterium]
MNKTSRWDIRTRLAALLLVVLGGSAAAAATPEIVIGQVAPLTGVLATTGKQMVVGGQVYFDWVNAQGGVHGAKIRTVVVDDGYKVDETLRLTQELTAR